MMHEVGARNAGESKALADFALFICMHRCFGRLGRRCGRAGGQEGTEVLYLDVRMRNVDSTQSMRQPFSMRAEQLQNRVMFQHLQSSAIGHATIGDRERDVQI